jgi:subtilisin family serine protease
MKNLLLFVTIACFCIACNTSTAPEIRQVRPRFVVPAGEVVILGSGFSSNLTVSIGGQNVAVSGFTASELKVKAPSLVAGSYDLIVNNSNQQSATSKGLNILASADNYFADQALVVFKENPDENKARLIASNAGMNLLGYKAAEFDTGICGKTLAVFGQQGGTSRAVDTASDIPDVLEANPHELGTGGAYSDSGPTTVTQHKNEFTALELDRAYRFWKTKIPTMPKRNPRVAVLDTGVAPHYDFRNLFNLTDSNLLAGKNFTSEVTNPAVGIELDVVDIAENASGLKVGHGTAVAAIIGARDSEAGNNFGNTFWQVGVLPAENVAASGAEILPVKVCDKTTKCKGIDVIKGICYAISQKSDVINLSLSTQQPSSIVKQAVQAATDEGIVVVASAGNRGTVPQYPAAHSLELPIIAVGSVRYDPSGKYKSSDFSVPGAWVNLVAPGETQSASFDSSHGTGFGYRSFEGTSFAAPWVSGVAAMLKALDPSQTPAQIRTKIVDGATRTNLECVPLEKCGNGLLNAARAIGAP